MINAIETLRKAGFFQSYSGLDHQELLNKLNHDRREQYSELFGSDSNYIPNPLTIEETLEMDDTKFLCIDLEADVCRGNRVYLTLVDQLSKASAGNFQPSDVIEVWTAEQGPIDVSFISRGEKVSFSPEYMDDWIDGRIFELVNRHMENQDGIRFWGCSGPNEEWLDQAIKIVRLSKTEKDILENTFGWGFYSL